MSVTVTFSGERCACLPADVLTGVFQAAGITDVRQYHYWDDKQRAVWFEKLLVDLEGAPEQSVVVLSASAHYPTGADLSHSQWVVIAQLIMVTGRIMLNIPDKCAALSPPASVSTEAEAVSFPPAAGAGALLWRFGAGRLARAVLCVTGDGAAVRSVVLSLLWTLRFGSSNFPSPVAERTIVHT